MTLESVKPAVNVPTVKARRPKAEK